MIQSQRLKETVLFASQQVTDGATITANLDTIGSAYATILINLGIEEGTDATTALLSLLESDDTVVTNFATITADLSQDLLAAKTVRYEVDLKGRKRFLRLSFTAGTETGSNALIGSAGYLSRNEQDPIGTTGLATQVVII